MGAELEFDTIVLWNRTDASYGDRLRGCRVIVLNESRQPVFEQFVTDAPAPSLGIELLRQFGRCGAVLRCVLPITVRMVKTRRMYFRLRTRSTATLVQIPVGGFTLKEVATIVPFLSWRTPMSLMETAG